MDQAQAIALAIEGARATDKPIREFRPTVIRASAVTAVTNPRDAYVEFLKDTALSFGKSAVIKLLVPQLPKFLTSGFVGSLFNPILGFIIGKALEIAIRETEIGMFFLYIDLRTSAQGREFEKFARANLDAQKNGTPAQKAKSEKELIDAFRAFVKFTN